MNDIKRPVYDEVYPEQAIPSTSYSSIEKDENLTDEEKEAKRQALKEETSYKANYSFINNVFTQGVDRSAVAFRDKEVFDVIPDNLQ